MVKRGEKLTKSNINIIVNNEEINLIGILAEISSKIALADESRHISDQVPQHTCSNILKWMQN